MPKLKLISNQTPDGEFHIITDEDDVAIVSGFGPVSVLQNRLPNEYQKHLIETFFDHPYSLLVDDYYKGNLNSLNIILKQHFGSDFQNSVWKTIQNVAPGKRITYKQLAEINQKPRAFRLVGGICKSNRLILLVPCHRVIKSDGGLGGYLYGLKLKKSLLDHESRFSN